MTAGHDTCFTPARSATRRLLGAGLIVAALVLVWFVRREDAEVQVLRLAGAAFATVYEVKIVAPSFPEAAGTELQARINAEVELVDKAMSRFRDDSEIARFNQVKSTEPFRVSKETATVLEAARRVSVLTGGAFDVSVGPLVRLWGFYRKQRPDTEPNADEIAEAKALVGYDALKIDSVSSTIRKTNPELNVDLSAVAKGYAVDRIAAAVERAGYHNYMVEIGGEVRVKGTNPKGRAWRIGIEKPIAEGMETYQVIELSNQAVATSGDYRNFYTLQGRRVSHTVDPRTGRPIEHQLASVTVVHDECAKADALATGLTVLGPKDGYNLAMEQNISALFITRLEDGTLEDEATPGFERLRASREQSRSSGDGKTR